MTPHIFGTSPWGFIQIEIYLGWGGGEDGETASGLEEIIFIKGGACDSY
jgi:hypothetical protein